MMKTKLIIFSSLMILFLFFFSCKTDKKTTSNQPIAASVPKQGWAIVIHGGAGGISRESITPELDKEYRASLLAAMDTGRKILSE